MRELKVKLTFLESILGTASADPEIHANFIASNAPDAPTRKEEIEAIGVEEAVEKAMTVFPRNKDGNPILWDYQIKGFFKNSCSALRKVSGSESSKVKAYKKEIDGLIFVKERQIPFIDYGTIGNCQRPLRASTAQGERIALANSEEIQAGAVVIFTIQCLHDAHVNAVVEWLDYGRLNGIGQWHNAGHGRFTWENLDFTKKDDWR